MYCNPRIYGAWDASLTGTFGIPYRYLSVEGEPDEPINYVVGGAQHIQSLTAVLVVSCGSSGKKRRANLRVTVVMASRFVTSWDRRLPHSPSPPCHPQDRDRRRYEAEIEKLEGKTRGALCSKTCRGNRAGRLRISRGNGKKPEEETHTCVRRAGGA